MKTASSFRRMTVCFFMEPPVSSINQPNAWENFKREITFVSVWFYAILILKTELALLLPPPTFIVARISWVKRKNLLSLTAPKRKTKLRFCIYIKLNHIFLFL